MRWVGTSASDENAGRESLVGLGRRKPPLRVRMFAPFCCPLASLRDSEPAPRPARGLSDASGRRTVTLFYWVGPETVNSFRLDSFLPSTVQTAPSASQSVVTGRITVTAVAESGVSVMVHPMLLPWVSRRALVTLPFVAQAQVLGQLQEGHLMPQNGPHPVLPASQVEDRRSQVAGQLSPRQPGLLLEPHQPLREVVGEDVGPSAVVSALSWHGAGAGSAQPELLSIGSVRAVRPSGGADGAWHGRPRGVAVSRDRGRSAVSPGRSLFRAFLVAFPEPGPPLPRRDDHVGFPASGHDRLSQGKGSRPGPFRPPSRRSRRVTRVQPDHQVIERGHVHREKQRQRHRTPSVVVPHSHPGLEVAKALELIHV